MARRRVRLVELRNNRNWYQKDVINNLRERFDIQITESYYGMIEQGTRTPKLNVALAIAQLFDVEPRDIFLTENPTKRCVRTMGSTIGWFE